LTRLIRITLFILLNSILNRLEPFLEETRREIIHLSPCLGILDNLREGRINIDGLHWRELEELIAELLEKDG
jgi:hypothetical protein